MNMTKKRHWNNDCIAYFILWLCFSSFKPKFDVFQKHGTEKKTLIVKSSSKINIFKSELALFSKCFQAGNSKTKFKFKFQLCPSSSIIILCHLVKSSISYYSNEMYPRCFVKIYIFLFWKIYQGNSFFYPHTRKCLSVHDTHM